WRRYGNHVTAVQIPQIVKGRSRWDWHTSHGGAWGWRCCWHSWYQLLRPVVAQPAAPRRLLRRLRLPPSSRRRRLSPPAPPPPPAPLKPPPKGSRPAPVEV